MMRTPASYLVIVACLFASAAYGACEMPALVTTIPDGASATEEELLAVQAEVKAYVAAMDEYIACENEEMAANEDEATEDYFYRMSARIESARNEVDLVASDFNDQVNAFRAARQTTNNPR